MSHEIPKIAGAEAVTVAEGHVCGTVMRGAVAPPGSKATSRTKGSRRNLGGLMSARSRRVRSRAAPGSEKRTPAMYGHEKSDGCVVPLKRANKAGLPAAERVEGRRPLEGSIRGQPCAGPSAGHRRPSAATMHGPELNGSPKPRRPIRPHPREEPAAGKPHGGICAGGSG